MKNDKIIERIWGNLEELSDQMTSGAAEGMTREQLEFVDESLSAILERTSGWFVDLVNRYAKRK